MADEDRKQLENNDKEYGIQNAIVPFTVFVLCCLFALILAACKANGTIMFFILAACVVTGLIFGISIVPSYSMTGKHFRLCFCSLWFCLGFPLLIMFLCHLIYPNMDNEIDKARNKAHDYVFGSQSNDKKKRDVSNDMYLYFTRQHI